MPICDNCGSCFPNFVFVFGKKRNLSARRYCLKCSPFGLHRTRPIGYVSAFFCVQCEEENPSCFYGKMRSMCMVCHATYNKTRCEGRKQFARDFLGGKCRICGYKKFQCSLAVHHTDPAQKDPNFTHMRGWSKLRIKQELHSCVLLCHNCHGAVHAGVLKGPVPASFPKRNTVNGQ